MKINKSISSNEKKSTKAEAIPNSKLKLGNKPKRHKTSNKTANPSKRFTHKRLSQLFLIVLGILLSLCLIGISIFNEKIEEFIKSKTQNQIVTEENAGNNDNEKSQAEESNSEQQNQEESTENNESNSDEEENQQNRDSNNTDSEDEKEDNIDDGPVTTNPSGYPDEILECTKNGDDLLVLVNKKYKLPSTYAPSDLVSVNNSGVRTTKTGLQVREIIIKDLKQLNKDIESEGIDIAVLSAYRSYTTQQSTYNYWVSTLGQTQADRVSARPGHSQHQLGTAVDFTSSEIGDRLGVEFAGTEAEKWLAQNAWKYGFVLAYPEGYEDVTGYSYEPWHYRYIGKENAAEWKSSGEILEVWLRGVV